MKRQKSAATIAADLAAQFLAPRLDVFQGCANSDLTDGWGTLTKAVARELGYDLDDSLNGQEAAFLLGVAVGRRLGGAQ